MGESTARRGVRPGSSLRRDQRSPNPRRRIRRGRCELVTDPRAHEHAADSGHATRPGHRFRDRNRHRRSWVHRFAPGGRTRRGGEAGDRDR